MDSRYDILYDNILYTCRGSQLKSAIKTKYFPLVFLLIIKKHDQIYKYTLDMEF